MKKTRLLKWIINVIFYISCATMIIVPIAAIIILIMIHTDGIVYHEKKIIHVGLKTVFLGVFHYLISLGFLYCLSLFRKIINLFIELEIFHQDVIKLFNQIGNYLIVLGFATLFFSYIPITYSYMTSTTYGYGFTVQDISKFTFDFLNFTWFVIIGVGLFFQVLSEIFKTSKSLKQENDLTI
jgi:hypothetical protein